MDACLIKAGSEARTQQLFVSLFSEAARKENVETPVLINQSDHEINHAALDS